MLTPTGFVNIEDVRVGDKVVTHKRTIETVTDVWPQGVVQLYRVTFADGRTIDACGEHLWQHDGCVSSTLDIKQLLANGTPVAIPEYGNKGSLPIASVVAIDKDYATCIAISGPDKLFVTTNYIVTHNSHTCLTKALKYINDPAARVLIVRRSYPALKLSGGLVDESKGIYKHFKGVFKIQPLTWVFPNGATIQFAALPDDLSEWQGLQATNILVDEAAEFTQEEIIFLVSRLRGANYKGHLNVLMTCNPSRDSFLFKWLEYCLDEETGIPKHGTEDIVRHFINVGGKLYWANSEEELWQQSGKGLGLVRGKTFRPMTFRFIPITINDNPILLKNNPQYLNNLLSQSRVNQLRFLHG